MCCDRRVIFQCFLAQDLKDLLRKAGEVTYADAHKPRTGEA